MNSAECEEKHDEEHTLFTFGANKNNDSLSWVLSAGNDNIYDVTDVRMHALCHYTQLIGDIFYKIYIFYRSVCEDNLA